jgi:NAD(P)-dependent dehydrogenase (short-subunit alcohol dehydrogenase family)
VRCDVSEETQVKAVIARAMETFGRIDVLVNNAGIDCGNTKLIDYNMADWDPILDVNLKGTALFIKYALPSMHERRRGAIVNVSSTWGRTAGPGKPAYVASKWGVVGLTQAIALEEGANGIRVNCVVPGYTMTDMMRTSRKQMAEREGISFEKALEKVAALSPQNRIVSPEEVAAVILWLASDHAIAVHGQTINANAALYMN